LLNRVRRIPARKHPTTFTIRLTNGKYVGNFGIRRNDTRAYDSVSGVSQVTDGNWHFLAGTFDGRYLKIYLDGALENAKDFGTTITVYPLYGSPVNIGKKQWTNYFSGLIDEVRIYLKALTEDEILAHYNEGIGQYGRTEPGLAAGWHFDEGEGTIAYDYSDNNNDGTIYGATWTDGHVLLPDVAIVDVAPSPIRVLRGQPVTINVTAKNLGGAHENFNVTAYYDNNPIETKIVTNLGKGESTTLTFTWDTTGVDLGYHTIKANATIVQGEINIKNNEMVYGTVWVVKPPVASFTYSPVPAIENRTTTFNAGGSTPNGGIITSYTWDFGDGNVTKTQNPVITHIYASHGTYNVTLTVEDSEGLNGTTWALVEVLRHDVKVVDITPYRNWIYKGWSININVTITNEGNFTEDVTLDLYYNITAGAKIETKSVSIDPGETKTLIFTWDTTDVKACRNYTITAVANIPIESDVSDNILDGPLKVKVRMFGDINGDDKIDMADIAPVAQAFGAFPGHQRWNPDLDLNRNNQVDLRDVAILARNFGKTCP